MEVSSRAPGCDPDASARPRLRPDWAQGARAPGWAADASPWDFVSTFPELFLEFSGVSPRAFAARADAAAHAARMADAHNRIRWIPLFASMRSWFLHINAHASLPMMSQVRRRGSARCGPRNAPTRSPWGHR